MDRFAQYIPEAKNVHMEHIEDSIFNEGSEGVNSAIAFLSSVTEMLSGNAKSGVNVTVKWDGAPAVFAGINPENGKFFVATKSIFNVNPKLNYTKADISRTVRELKFEPKYSLVDGIKNYIEILENI